MPTPLKGPLMLTMLQLTTFCAFFFPKTCLQPPEEWPVLVIHQRTMSLFDLTPSWKSSPRAQTIWISCDHSSLTEKTHAANAGNKDLHCKNLHLTKCKSMCFKNFLELSVIFLYSSAAICSYSVSHLLLDNSWNKLICNGNSAETRRRLVVWQNIHDSRMIV